jgi:pseudolysin
MRNNLSLVVSTACLALSFSANAAESRPLHQAALTDIQDKFVLILPNVKAIHSSANTLNFINQHQDVNKITHIRMQQEYLNFPVFGGYIIIHSSKFAHGMLSAQHAVVSGKVYEGLQQELGQPDAHFTSQMNTVLQQFIAPYQHALVSEEGIVPIVYVNKNGQASWAYKVTALISDNADIPKRPVAIIDAQTLKTLVQWNALQTIRPVVKGMGFGGNHLGGEYQFGKDFPFLTITRDPISAICYMENDNVKVIDMEHQYVSHSKVMTFNCGQADPDASDRYWTGNNSDGYDLQNGAFSPSNDALYAGEVVRNLYKEWYGLDVLMKRNKPMKLVMRVHYGKKYANAYWDEEQMTFGDGDALFYPLVSLGIAAHEISHGFTTQHSNLQYFDQSGGINEAFSDMAAQAAEYYSQMKNSWMIGSEVIKENNIRKALRFMDMPSRDKKSIDRAEQFKEDMDVHYSSGVYNRFFYLLANKPQWAVRQAFQVMVKANMDYWTPYSNFQEAGCGVIYATQDYGLPVDDVKSALDEVGINSEVCVNRPVS